MVPPPELVAEVNRLVGPRRRSQFFLDAAAENLARLKLAQSAAKAAGSLAEVDTPEWESPEAASAWVRATRRGDDDHRRARATA